MTRKDLVVDVCAYAPQYRIHLVNEKWEVNSTKMKRLKSKNDRDVDGWPFVMLDFNAGEFRHFPI